MVGEGLVLMDVILTPKQTMVTSEPSYTVSLSTQPPYLSRPDLLPLRIITQKSGYTSFTTDHLIIELNTVAKSDDITHNTVPDPRQPHM